MLEDKHIQLDLSNTLEKSINDLLLNFDIILRANEDNTKYESFDIFDYKNQTMLATIKLDGSKAYTYK